MKTSKDILIELGIELEAVKNKYHLKKDSEYNKGVMHGLEIADKFISYFCNEIERNELKQEYFKRGANV